MKSKDKIFIFSCVHQWNDVRIYYKEAASLSRLYDVQVHAIADFEYKRLNDIDVYGLPNYGKRYKRPLLWWTLLSRAIRAHADVYHFHDPELIPTALILKILRKKVIYDIHEDYPKAIVSKSWIPSKVRGIVSAAFNWFEKTAAKAFDYNITVTDDIAQNFKNSDIAVIKNYPLYEQHDISHKRPKDEIWAVYVGVLAPIRGIKEMVEAAAYIKPEYKFKLKLAGRFMSSEVEKNIRSISGFNVDILGFLDYKEVYELLVQSDMGLVCLHPVPNYITSLPIKMFEYMSCALPIIASDFPLWREIVVGNQCGITVDPKNPEEIARAIEYLADNPDIRHEMGMKGYEAYKEKYNWGAEENKLFDVYKYVLGK
ncbi:MAG: hypothetical protein PWP55_865 [Clostridiales bacterium]|nr:hypothetical protein [Clostridiales bacterium]